MIRKLLMAAAVASVPAMASAATLELTGIVRDFKRGDRVGGHPDFQTAGAMGRFGLVPRMTEMWLSEDGKPVYASNRPSKDTMQSAESFAQWYRDTPGVNASTPLRITLSNGQTEPGGVYTYQNNAFWPINNQLFGNEGFDKNFHFTFELHTRFSYEPGQYFVFVGDDDVWVYINGKKVIDIGGVHGATSAAVLLFDGKAFVENAHFKAGDGDGMVKVVSEEMEAQIQARWNRLAMPGMCLIRAGDEYVELGIEGADVQTNFRETEVSIAASETLSTVTLAFVDGTEQVFDSLSSYTGTFRGTGYNEGKELLGAWVTTSDMQAGAKGPYYSPKGSSVNMPLDFFFAERHTTQSNFRIDTSMNLVEVEPTTISPLYD